MSKIIKKQIEVYQNNFNKYLDSTRGVFWNNVTSQHERFNQLMTPLLPYTPQNFSICDVGSGICDLHYFLNKKN